MNKYNRLSILMVFLFIIQILPPRLNAQETSDEIKFTEGLVLKYHSFRRTGVRSDPVEKSIVQGTWKAPRVGEEIAIGDTTIAWQSIVTDSTGWIQDRAIRGGYVYFQIASDQDQIMLLENNGNDYVYVNGNLRVGNRYGYKENWEAWEPNFNFSILPVQLKNGQNNFLFRSTRSGRLKANLMKTDYRASLNTKDATLPDFITGEEIDTWGAVVIMNTSPLPLKSFKIAAQIGNNSIIRTEVPQVQKMTVRKIGFRLQGNAQTETGKVEVRLQLLDENDELAYSTTIQLQVKNPNETHKRTFISKIDGSVQYYAINPAQQDPEEKKALVLSVHGAAVEAINQAGSYYGKTWAHIVSPTNRRPYGFNWEDWGRSDALEVLEIAQNTLNIDQGRIYLTGHSMGGHGSWHLGGTFPDKFAAIGPSAGWLSFWSYRVREETEEKSAMQKMLIRPTTPSNTLAIAENYKQHGVYIIHGADDDNVRAGQSRQMVEHLEKFHKDFIYHEEPGQGHWWDISDEPGSDCVDWAPLFDFFARHARPEKDRIRQIEFITASPGISAKNNWLTIEAQEQQLNLSKVNIRVDPGKRRFVGTTENVARMSFDLTILNGDEPILFDIDGQKIEDVKIPSEDTDLWLEKKDNQWKLADRRSPADKGPHRYGTFKDAFQNRFMFVYGTQGSERENNWAYAKARYDAEYFWYQGNGSIDVITDKEFDPTSEPDRNIILYGNSQTNSAWKKLLSDSPVQVSEGKISVGQKTVWGDDLGCLFIRPRPGSDIASVGAVSGTGITGMRVTDRRSYLSPGYGYPDLTIFTPELITDREKGVKAAGFFGLDWSLESGEMVWNSEL